MAREVLNKGPVLKAKARNPVIEFDRLQMYFEEPYVIDLEDVHGSITIYSPSLGEVIEIGEKKFYQGLNILCTNTTANRLMLWEAGLDWNEVTDFELFAMLINSIDDEVSKLFFHEVNIKNFERCSKLVDDKPQLVLYNSESDIEINEQVYFHISQYIRTMFNYFPEEKLTKDPFLKKAYIAKDKRQIAIEEEKRKKGKSKNNSFLQSQISAFLCHPGTKYKKHELKEVGICEFFDSLQRLQIYESSTALMKGMYSGFVDSKHIKAEDYNFMRDINK